MVMMPANGQMGVCLGTSPNQQQTPPQPGALPGAPQGPNGGAACNDGLLMPANAPPNGSGYYGMDVPQAQQSLNVQPGAAGTGPVDNTSPTGGADPLNPNGNRAVGVSQPQAAGEQDGYMAQQRQTNSAATQNYSTTGQGTWTGANTLTYTQAMQPDMQRQQGNYCKSTV